MPYNYDRQSSELEVFDFEGRTAQPFGSYVYTYRNRVTSPPLPDQSVFGIPVPDYSGMSLIQKMEARKLYLESLDRQLVRAADQNPDSMRFSTTDTGNEFVSVKYGGVPVVTEADCRNGSGVPVPAFSGKSSKWISLDPWCAALPQGVRKIPNHPLNNTGGSILPASLGKRYAFQSASDRQGTANYMFRSTIPDSPVSQVGELLIGLIRGDLPRMFSFMTSFPRILEKAGGMNVVKKAASEAGGQYLNAVFGWIPSVNDVINFITGMLQIHDLVFSRTERRKRQSAPVYSYEEFTGRLWESVLVNFDGNFIKSPLGSREAFRRQSTSQGGDWPGTYKISGFRDHRFSARYTCAKPSPAALGFAERGAEAIRRLGISYDNLVWDITPYSWLVDWWLTLGHSISNVQAYSPLSGRYNVDYAYLTTVENLTVEFVPDIKRYTEKGWNTTHFSWNGGNTSSYYLTKVRERANPFGFGTNLDQLNAGQFAILSALGLAKVR